MATDTKKPSSQPLDSSKKAKMSTTESTAAAARRAKKREQDRQCQQRARQRTRERIVYLEEMVQNLKQQNTTKAMEDVWRQRDEIAAQRDALAETLRVIERALQSSRKDVPLSLLPTEDLDAARKQERSDSSDGQSYKGGHEGLDQSMLDGQHDPPQDTQMAFIATDDANMLDNTLAWSQNMANTLSPSSHHDPIIPYPQHSCECSPAPTMQPRQQTINYWRFANETLTEPAPIPEAVKQQEEEMEHDTPVRAMLEGWDAVERRAGGNLPPSWQKLRQIDEVIFQTLPKTERLAIMRVMHSLFRYHQEKSPEKRAVVPSWHLARPSQEIAHSYAIDYFAWPGIRERFVFHQHRYCSNRFWTQFCKDLRVLWPFEFRDCYSRNIFTGEYKMSPAFLDRIQDIRAWTMSEGMFDLYPEFRSDIPTFDPSMASIVFRPPLPPADDSNTSPSDTSQTSHDDREHGMVKTMPQPPQQMINPDCLVASQDHFLLTGDILQSFNDFGDLLFTSTAANAEALPVP